MEPQIPSQPKKNAGSIIGIVIIVILLIIAGFYFWGSKLSVSKAPGVSKSDDISSIETDLQATTTAPDLSGLE